MSEDESTNGDEEKDIGGAKSRPANQAMIMALADRIEKLNEMNKSVGDMVGGMDATLYNLGLAAKSLEARVEALEEQLSLLIPEEDSGELDPNQKTLNDVFDSEDE
ncbi:MAG: hypothetical protein CMB45_05100 [Euryarchaeota archaeon]|nr:hypothetical protein [Euryarchaeota archaeon]|tara:strand:- start:11494 stop:11811 length:318 start_codon:yes stop_codon:yes gene_type:complete